MLSAADAVLQDQGPGAIPIANKLRAEAENIASFPGPDRMPFDQAERFKTTFANLARYDKIRNAPAEMGAREVADVFRTAVNDEATKVANQSGNPDLAKSFFDAKAASGWSQKAADMTEKAEGRRLQRNMLSPSATAVQIGGALTGHGIAATAGSIAYQQLKDRAPATLAVTARAGSNLLQKIVQTQPGRLGAYGGILARALQAGGQQAFDSHAFVLSQTDPKFQELSQKVASEGDGGSQ
jgi:hypothetical protein